ncbi:hypothetical protein GIB67_005650 [Kingdonia uniflora]|uniref:Uncharacterized protein n=1 Tax=Kingdonia uniflora TaxID=39325 RepID=A0A7J7NIG8_9MAGN|nr:hypothetical protein GIB67_005650 [Kingdonia uniflora]
MLLTEDNLQQLDQLYSSAMPYLTISVGHLFTNNAHLIWESLRKGTQTLWMYYARLRSSWEQLSHYDSFIEWPASAPSEKVHISPKVTEIYAKIVEKTRVFQFFAGLNPDFEYARVHLLDRTPYPTLEEAHAYCLSDQSRRSPMPPISGIPSETSIMVVPYAYPAPLSVPSQTSHTLSPSLSPLLTTSSNSCPPRKKCDYCVRVLSQGECFPVRPLPLEDLFSPPSDPFPLSVPYESVIPPLVSPSISHPLQVYTRRYPGRQPPTTDCQASSVALGLSPAIDSPLSGIEPYPTAFIPVTTDDDSPVSHSTIFAIAITITATVINTVIATMISVDRIEATVASIKA